MSGGVSSYLGGGGVFAESQKALQAATQIVVGGTSSKLSGGKFANGAISSAFSLAIGGLFPKSKKTDNNSDQSKDERHIRAALKKAMEGKLGFEWPAGVEVDLSLIDTEIWVGGVINPDGSIDFSQQVLYEGAFDALEIERLGLHRATGQAINEGNGRWTVQFYKGSSDRHVIQTIALSGLPSSVDPYSYEVPATGIRDGFSAEEINSSRRAAEYVVTHEVFSHIINEIGGGWQELDASLTAYDHLVENVWK